jgi:biotin transport system substrate-specific component
MDISVKSYPSKAIFHFIPTILQIILASCLIGICAQIKIPLYFTPIPLTVQTSAVMVLGALLGSKKGALAALCYLIQGWSGLPVWAGGSSGFLHFMGPTGGYLMAYVAQAFFIGWLLEKRHNTPLISIIGVLLMSICLQMGMGSLWLAQFVGIQRCFMLGFYPFILNEVVRAIMAAIIVKYFSINHKTNPL